MTEEEARARLESMVAWNVAPVLTSGEVDDLLDQARRADSNGLAPGDASWTPTWHFASPAAAGWRLKAGKVANEFSFTSDGQTHNRNEVFEMCMAMADRYARGAVGSIPLLRDDPYATEHLVGNG